MIYALKKISAVVSLVFFVTCCVGVASGEEETIIVVGDHVLVALAEDPSFVFDGVVDLSGEIDLPYIGGHQVAGVSVAVAGVELSRLLESDYYWKATTSISIIGHGPSTIYVYGAVKEPGLLELPAAAEISIPQALAAVKGLTSWADAENCYIIRRSASGEDQKIAINIREQLLGAMVGEQVRLVSRDELFVPSLNNSSAAGGGLLTNDPLEVIIVGQVNSPGVIKFAPGEEATLMRAVFKAGGLTRFAKGEAVKLIRYSGEVRQVEVVDLEVVITEGFLEQDRALLPGDMVIVPQKFINF